MKKNVALLLPLYLASFSLLAQPTKALPLSINRNSDTSKPIIFYISGDGGFNKFSTAFMQTLNQGGYTVIGLDAKDYFWNKKKPQEAANAIEGVINQYLKEWKHKNIILIGYSFGADVAPFILTHFSSQLVTKVRHLVLLSPSAKTDFEIHITDILGFGKNNGASVPDEINKITVPVLFVIGKDEDDFPFNQIVIKNKEILTMAGGHHYDGDIPNLSKQVILRIK